MAKRKSPRQIEEESAKLSGAKKTPGMYTKGQKSMVDYSLPEVCHSKRGLPNLSSSASTITKRSGFNRHDFDRDRPDDKLPNEHAEIIRACQAVYKKIGMVRNIIDLMTDFAAEGLELQHPIKTQERFYRAWAKKVDLIGRGHDFMKLLMRDANVIVRRKNAQISVPVANEMSKGANITIDTVDETKVSQTPQKIGVEKRKVRKREIPWRYTFLSPVLVEKISGEVGRFFGSDDVGLRIPRKLASEINKPRNKSEKAFVDKLPPEVIRAARTSSILVKLDMDKIYIDYYKKDDWEDWGTPFLYGVLEDVMLKEKMRLADMAALDGVINVIRLWRLGKSDQQIFPTPSAVDKLIGILDDNVGGGALDLVWDDMIDLQVEYPPTDKILGADKYVGVNSDIVRGLGIPDSLVGGQDLGTRNAQSAFVQLKTLVERLEYVRSRAITWMENELKLVAQAMGFKRIPSISFGIMSLRDEAAEKQLMIQLLDRGIISAEKASEVFGTNYMIELERLKTEQNIREKNSGVLEKAGPYYRPQSVMEKQTDLTIQIEKVKQGFRRDSVFPGDNNNTNDNGGGDNPSGDQPTDEGNNSPGRPPSTKDTQNRDSRTSPTLSMLNVMSHGMLDRIDNFVDPKFLDLKGVKNIRLLTKSQKKELERVKRGILSVMQPNDQINQDLITQRMSEIKTKSNAKCMEKIFLSFISDFTTSENREPTTKERKMITCLSWATMFEGVS